MDRPAWKDKLYEIIFEAETPVGKAFDVVLLLTILASVLAVMLESVGSIRRDYRAELVAAEWVFTLLFTIEYVLRLICCRRPLGYARSFFGVIDLLAILPSYLNLIFSGAHYLMIIRILRLLRVFRIFKLVRYVSEADVLMTALRASRRKITVFLGTVLILVIVIGALMFLIEGEENGFTSIPRSVYWAIVTLTTVGYGDIAPQTLLGQLLACVVMIMGYGIIAVPTGIVSVELHQASHRLGQQRACANCRMRGHDKDASFCKGCGHRLNSGFNPRSRPRPRRHRPQRRDQP